jgi:hypothetical protein
LIDPRSARYAQADRGQGQVMRTFLFAAFFLFALGLGVFAGLWVGRWSYSSARDGRETAYAGPELLNKANRDWVSREKFAKLSDVDLGELYDTDPQALNGKVVGGGLFTKAARRDVLTTLGHPVEVDFLYEPAVVGAGVCEVHVEQAKLVDSFVLPVGWRLKPTARSNYTAYALSGVRPDASLAEQSEACAKLRDPERLFLTDPGVAMRAALAVERLSSPSVMAAKDIRLSCEDKRSDDGPPCDAPAVLKTALKLALHTAATKVVPLPDGGARFEDLLMFETSNGGKAETVEVRVTSDQARPTDGAASHVVAIDIRRALAN